MAGSGQRNEWITNTKTKRWNIWKKQTQIDLFNVPHALISKRSAFLVFGEQCSERLHFPSRGWPIGGTPGQIALTLDFQVLNFTLEPNWRSKTPWAKGPAHFDIPPRHVMYFRMGWLKVKDPIFHFVLISMYCLRQLMLQNESVAERLNLFEWWWVEDCIGLDS